jgi:hypothetical protein
VASEVTARVGHKWVTETGLHRPDVRVMKMLSFRCEECASEYAIIEVSARAAVRARSSACTAGTHFPSRRAPQSFNTPC